MSISNLKQYPRVILLFHDGYYTEYTPGSLVKLKDIMEAQMILAFQVDGTTKILKNRWGNTSRW
jgi:hypothetical protein